MLRSEDLRPMMSRLSVPKPRPTRKTDMVAAVESRLAGESLRRLWDDLDETQRFAVSEALHDPESGFHPERFKAKYGALPAGFGRFGTPESSCCACSSIPRTGTGTRRSASRPIWRSACAHSSRRHRR